MNRAIPIFAAVASALLGSALHLAAAEMTFQNGLDGYEGAASTTLHGVNDKQMISNYGGDEILGVAGVKHGGIKQLGLVKFGDFIGSGNGQVPQGAVIATARLELYKLEEPRDSGQYANTPKQHLQLRAFKMLTDWKAGSAKGEPEEGSSCFTYRYFDTENPTFWGTANVLEEGPVRLVDFQFTPHSAAQLLPASGPTWVAWNITEYVQEWVNDPGSNHGVFLNALGFWVGSYFASCQHSDASLRPRLVVEYD